MKANRLRLSCIILAGGKNTRIGQEKAFLKVGNKIIIEEQIVKLRNIFEEMIIVANSLKNFKNFKAKVVKDIIPESGPLGGLYSGLAVSSNIHNFLIGCDMPFINRGLLKYMLNKIDDNDIVIPYSKRGIETLFAVYSINCLETIRNQIKLNNLKLTSILKYHRVRYISPKEISVFDPDELSFFNINTAEDYKRAQKLWLKMS